jgi:hypothetical protein
VSVIGVNRNGGSVLICVAAVKIDLASAYSGPEYYERVDAERPFTKVKVKEKHHGQHPILPTQGVASGER